MAEVTCPDCGKMVTDRCVCGFRVTAAIRSQVPALVRDGEVTISAGTDPFAVPSRTLLLSVESADRNRSLPIEIGGRVEIGRSVGFVGELCSDNISQHHATFEFSEHGLSVEDIGSGGHGSTNGTYVNGVRIRPREPYPLELGDIVELARDPTLRIVVGLA